MKMPTFNLRTSPLFQYDTISWPDLLSKPLINADVDDIGNYQVGRTICEHNRKVFAKLERALPIEPNCARTKAFMLTLMANHLNYTLVFGRLSPSGWHDIYFKAIILQQVLTVGAHSMIPLSTASFEVLDDRIIVLFYGERNTRSRSWNILSILANPFDSYTWVAIASLTLSAFIYFILEQRDKMTFAKLKDLLFEMVSIAFQQGYFHPSCMKCIILVMWFMINFLHTSIMTGNMISPSDPQIYQSLSELLRKGFKLELPPSSRDLGFNETYAYQQDICKLIKFKLISESFRENICSSGSHWEKHLRKVDFPSKQEYKKAVKSVDRVMQLIFITTTVQYYRHKKVNKKIRRWEKYVKNEFVFHVVPKTYPATLDFYWIDGIQHAKVKKVLGALLYESGIKAYWNDILDKHYKRNDAVNQNTEGKSEDDFYKERGVAKMRIDERFTGVLKVTGVIMIPAFSIFLFELFSSRNFRSMMFTNIRKCYQYFRFRKKRAG